MRADWLLSQRTLAFTGLLFALSLAITLPALALDDRLFDGANVWLKTVKFQIALAVYLLSLVFYAQWAPPALLESARFRIYVQVVCVMCLAEILWVAGASAFATASHYNDSSAAMAAIYGLMGIFAVTLTSVSLVLGWAILRDPDSRLDPPLQLAIGVSLILTFFLTVTTAGVLASQPGHFIGEPQSGAVLPVMGWSREVGDLRVAHFFATHAMHVLPLIGLAAYALPGARLRKAAVLGAAAFYCAFVGVLFAQALAGKPFLPLV